jgi:O-antigen/teichoic acid export membrane protein
MESKGKKLFDNTIIFFIGNIGSKIIQFLLVPLYTYCLTTAQFGTTELVLNAIYIVSPIFSISITDGMLRFGLDKKIKKQDVLLDSIIIAAVGCVISILCIPIYYQFDSLKGWIPYFVLIMNFRTLQDVLSVNLKIKGQNRQYALNSMIYSFAFCAFNILLLSLFKLGIDGYFLSYILAYVISIIYLLYAGNVIRDIRSASFDVRLVKKLVIYSLPMIVNALSGWIITASDKFMINFYMDNSAVGLYSVATKIPTILTTLSSIFMQAWTLSAIDEYENEEGTSFYSNIYSAFLFFVGFASLVIIGFIQPFMKVYVSKSYYSSWIYVPFLVFGTGLMSIVNFFGGVYVAHKKNMRITITTLIGAVSNIVLNFTLIPKYGIQGAVIATFISWLIVSIYRYIDVVQLIHKSLSLTKSLLFFVLCLFVSLVAIKGNYIITLVLTGIFLLIWLFFNRKVMRLSIDQISIIIKDRISSQRR